MQKIIRLTNKLINGSLSNNLYILFCLFRIPEMKIKRVVLSNRYKKKGDKPRRLKQVGCEQLPSLPRNVTGEKRNNLKDSLINYVSLTLEMKNNNKYYIR